MSYGYSARLIALNKSHNDTQLGVKLGRVCIALDIPVSRVASQLGVSKQTVYNWFMGMYDPHPKYQQPVELLIETLNKRK